MAGSPATVAVHIKHLGTLIGQTGRQWRRAVGARRVLEQISSHFNLLDSAAFAA